MTTKRCAVCGDTTELNVRLAWRRDSDGKTVNVCCLCAESGKVNETSIDNFTTEDTIYVEKSVRSENRHSTMGSFFAGGRSAFAGGKRSRNAYARRVMEV